MQPTHAEFAEDVIPIEISRLKLACRSQSAIRNSHRPAYSVTAFSKVESIAREATDAIERQPFDELCADAALQNKIFKQPSHFIVGKRSRHRCLHPETPAQSTRDVVFTAAFPNSKFTRGADASLAGIKSQHDFAKREKVVGARGSGFDLKFGHD